MPISWQYKSYYWNLHKFRLMFWPVPWRRGLATLENSFCKVVIHESHYHRTEDFHHKLLVSPYIPSVPGGLCIMLSQVGASKVYRLGWTSALALIVEISHSSPRRSLHHDVMAWYTNIRTSPSSRLLEIKIIYRRNINYSTDESKSKLLIVVHFHAILKGRL